MSKYKTVNKEVYEIINTQYNLLTFKELANLLEPTMTHIAYHYSKGCEVDDMKQLMLMKLYEAHDTFDGDKGVKYTTYMFQVLKNHCIDNAIKETRTKVREVSLDNLRDSKGYEVMDTSTNYKVEFGWLYDMLDDLPEHLKEYCLTFIDNDGNISKTCKAYGISRPTHYSWMAVIANMVNREDY